MLASTSLLFISKSSLLLSFLVSDILVSSKFSEYFSTGIFSIISLRPFIGYEIIKHSNGVCNNVYPKDSIFSKFGISFLTPFFVVIENCFFLKENMIYL